MKTCYGLGILAATVLVAGCGKEQSSSGPAPSSAPSGYVGALAKGQQTAVKTIDVTSLNQEIQLFNAQEGRNPTDLNELVSKNYIGKLPDVPQGMKFVYDATQGKVSLTAQ
jgi:nitrous oxide reductase accessory protein NosL